MAPSMVVAAMLSLLLLPSATNGHAVSYFRNDPCIDSNVCSCGGGATINCDCSAPSVEAQHRSTALDILPFMMQRHLALKSITLRRCPSVSFHQAALSTCPPNGVLVESVATVALATLAFHEMVDCRRLAFVDVGIGLLRPYAFHAVHRVRSIEFRDAKIGGIDALAFVGLREVGALSFVNCHVGALQPLAVSNATRVQRISFIDCDIGVLGDEAVAASHVGHFEMINTTVGRWGQRAVALVEAQSVTLIHNRLGALHATAFDGLVDAVDIVVAKNVLGGDAAAEVLAGLYAAASTLPANWTLVVRDNELTCDERLCQLLSQQHDEDIDAAFFALTKCANGTRTLAEFLTMVDDDDECPYGGIASGAGNTGPVPDASASGLRVRRLSIGTIAAGAALVLWRRLP